MNQADPTHGRNRREFVRDGVRYSVLAGIAVVSALLLKRSGGTLTGQTCVNQGICSGCGAFAGCGLPAALSAKEYQLHSGRREEAQASIPERDVHAASTSQGRAALKRAEARAPKAKA
jgi:hypothetical protein